MAEYFSKCFFLLYLPLVWNFCINRKVLALLFICCLYCIYPKYSDTSIPYHTCSKLWTSTIYYPMLCLNIAGWVPNSVDPDEMPHFVASHLGLQCLLRLVCLNTYSKYGMWLVGRSTNLHRYHCKFTKLFRQSFYVLLILPQELFFMALVHLMSFIW